jgi:CubicO group peptidase (beta-lactamase class C family)
MGRTPAYCGWGAAARLAALALLPLGTTAAPGSALDEAAVDGLVCKALAAWHVPGVAVAIVKDGKATYLKGHGVRRLGRPEPVTPDTLFPIASCTKAFTTAAMAVLADEGKMAWDDPVRKHLPWFHLADPRADRLVTLRDLLTHRTGLRSHDLLWYRSPWTQEEIIRRAGRLPLDKPFRGAFQYQSTMFTAAGHAVAAAAGTPWADFVRKRLLEPLGMTGVVFTTKDACARPDYAFPHRPGPRGEPEVIDFCPQEVPDPAGAVHAGARDLAKWLLFQLGDGTVAGGRVVSARNLLETHTPQIDLEMDRSDRQTFPETRRMSYGLGWVIFDNGDYHVLAHGGVIDGFRSYLLLVPERRLGIVLLNNLHQTRMNTALGNSLLDLLLGRPSRDWNAIVKEVERQERADADARQRDLLARRVPGTQPSCDWAAYAGTYEHPAYGEVTVSVGPGGLVWQWHSFRAVLEHFHYDTFTLPVEVMGRPQVVFRLDDHGGVRAMKVEGRLGVEFRRRS